LKVATTISVYSERENKQRFHLENVGYLEKNLGRLVIDKRNDTSTGRFNEFHIRRRNIGSVGGIAEASGGAVAGVAKDTDHRPVVELGVGRDAPGRVGVELTREKNRGLGLGDTELLRVGNDQRDPEIVPDIGEAGRGGRGRRGVRGNGVVRHVGGGRGGRRGGRGMGNGVVWHGLELGFSYEAGEEDNGGNRSDTGERVV